MTTIDLNKKTKVELVALCKEKRIRGYAKKGIKKEDIMKKNNIDYTINTNIEKFIEKNIDILIRKNIIKK